MIRFVSAACAVLVAGCVACASSPSGIGSAFTSLSLDHQYQTAMGAYERQDYALAVAAIENLIDRLPPKSAQREEIYYKQGVAYLKLKNYYDAERVLQGYILDYRGGRYEEEAALYCAAIATARAELGHAAEARLEAAIGDLNRLLELEKEHPSDPEIKYQLGNIYYEVGEYEDAGKKYFEAQELEAAYRQNELVMRRLFINDQGEPEALSPGALQRIERERHPLVIFDKMTYYQRRTSSSFSARQVYAVLTGKVRNQGSQRVRGVTIEVRFLNARNQILDVQPVQIGTLGPGEVRAFLARASNYDSLLNITRIDTIARSDP